MWAEEELRASELVERLNALCEPYRQNAIAWLEACAHERFTDVGPDLTEFLQRLTPAVRDRFLLHTGAMLDDALRYFGPQN